MSGWVCHTRKLLSAILTSIADDLEQTVQDFNDSISRFSATSDSSDSRSEDSLTDVQDPGQSSGELEEETSQLSRPSDTSRLTPPTQIAILRDVPARVTTRQPEPGSFASRSSQSSPARQRWDDSTEDNTRVSSTCNMSHVADQEGLSINEKETTRMSPRPQNSISTPYLKVLDDLSEFQEETCATILTNERDSDIVLLTESDTVANTDHLNEMNLCKHAATQPPQRFLFFHSTKLLSRGHGSIKHEKLPGKVVRTTVPGRGGILTNSGFKHLSCLSNKDMDRKYISKESTNDCYSREVSCDGRISPVCDERDRNVLVWTGLRPLVRILSFAVSQLSSVVIHLTDRSPATPAVTSGVTQPREIYSKAPSRISPTASSEDLVLQQVLQSQDDNLNQSCPTESQPAWRSYSSESFEILQLSSFSCSTEDCTCCSNDQVCSQHSPKQLSTHTIPETNNQRWKTSESVYVSVAPTDLETMTSSAELVNFDFQKLITDQNVVTLGSLTQNMNLNPKGQGDGDSLMDSFCLVQENLEKERMIGESEVGCNRLDKIFSTLSQEGSDSDGESSASFIIFSDKDCEEDYIMF